MGTVRRIDDNRGVAVRRYQHGESVRSIATSLGRSRWWVYKWLARAATGGPAWATDRSRRPPRLAARAARRRGGGRVPRAPRALQCRPAVWVAEHPLALGRPGRHPAPVGPNHHAHPRPGGAHPPTDEPIRPQGHAVPGPASGVAESSAPDRLRRPVLPPGARPVLEPPRSGRGDGAVRRRTRRLPGRPSHGGCRLGDLAPPGAPDPCASGQRAGLLRQSRPSSRHGTPHPPVSGAGHRAVAERRRGRFNTHFRSKFLAWIQVPDFPGLRPASLAFEARHNSRYRYTRLHGQTPCAALDAQQHSLRFPAQEAPPTVPLPKPEAGRYHVVRFIRSDRRLDVFGERFLVPLEAQYAYVVGTVGVARQRLTVTLAGDLIAEWPYPLRCRPLREC